MINEEILAKFDVHNYSELYKNAEALSFFLQEKDIARIDQFSSLAWTEENIKLFLELYKNQQIYFIPEELSNNSNLLTYFLDNDMDCYEFTENAWTTNNINKYFSKDEIESIPVGLQKSSEALAKVINMKIYELISYFKESAWNKELVIKYFSEVPKDEFELPEELLNNREVIQFILENGLARQYKDFFDYYQLNEEDIETYIKYLKNSQAASIDFPNDINLLKRILEEKMEQYYSCFNDIAWTEECIKEYLNNYSISEYAIPNKLRDNSSLLKYILNTTSDFNFNIFNSTAWTEENIKLFENLLLNNDYKYELPYCFKINPELLKFFLLNHLTKYFDFFYNGTWNKENIRLFIGIYISSEKEVEIPYFLKYDSETLKYILLYNKQEYYNNFIDEAWTEENLLLLEEQIKKGLSKDLIPDSLKNNILFLNYVLDNKLEEYYDYFTELSEIDEEADKYLRLFNNNPNIGFPLWFTSSPRALQLILNNKNSHQYIKLFREKAWNDKNTTLYLKSFPNKDNIILYPPMFRSKNVLKVLLNQKVCFDKLSLFPLDLWTEDNIKTLISFISNDELITQTLQKNLELLDNMNLKKEFLKYILDNYQNLNINNINKFSEIIVNIDNSNSSEIERLKEELAPLLLNTSHPQEAFSTIEKIFLSNHLPSIAKKFYVYQIFHKDITETKETISPVLQNHPQYQDHIILSDLLKVCIESNNDSLRNYLIRLNGGHKLLLKVLNNNISIDQLDYKNYSALDDYVKNIYLLYNSSRYSKDTKYLLTNNILVDIKNLLKLLQVEPEKLLDRIIRMYFGLIGINTYDEVVLKIYEAQINATKRGIKHAKEGLEIHKGDFIKGINDVKFLSNILNNGAVATEFLGEAAKKNGDCTPLDTDCSIIEEEQAIPSIFLNPNIQANNYGNTWLVLKNDDRFITTRKDKNDQKELDNISYQGNKLEAFSTLGKDHYGIRTGFGSTCIDYIVTKEYSQDMAFTIAKNGFYIPVYNTNGELLFSIDDYYKISNQMAGLSHYGNYLYEFSSNLDFPGIEQVINQLNISEKEMINQKRTIESVIEKSLSKLGLEMKNVFDGDLSRNKCFFLDIGSTGRKTNLPSESDFDYLLLLDKSIIKNKDKMKEITVVLRQALGKSNLGYEDKIVNGYDFRFTEVSLEGIEPIKIDITFEGKTDAINYSSDMCVIDRLNTMKNISKTDTIKARANIIMAKKILKEAGVYKSKLSSNPEGGMSAIGIENWILEHGGSFIDAATDFINKYEESLEKHSANDYISKSTIWTRFKNNYQVYNFGENYYSLKKDFIPLFGEFVSNNMDENGLPKMYNCLKSYILNNEIKKGL